MSTPTSFPPLPALDARTPCKSMPRRSTALLSLAFLGLALAAFRGALGFRGDLETVGTMTIFGPSILQAIVALGLMSLVVLRATPGRLPATDWVLLTSGIGLLVHLVASPLAQSRGAITSAQDGFWSTVAFCFAVELLLAVPVLVLVARALQRGLVARALSTGLAGGAVAGLLGDSVWHLFCPYSDAGHVGFSHTAPILLSMGILALLLVVMERRRS